MRRRPTALVAALALAFAPPSPQAHEADAPGPEISERECGKAALAMLLMLEGVSDPMRGLDARLVDPPEAGYSMLELRDAARACGLDVEAAELGRDGAEIDRSTLALLSGPSSNHYVVARPIPGRRPMVQVIDPRGPSSIMRRDELTASPAWTGFSLRPQRSPILGPWSTAAVVGAAVAGATYASGVLLARSQRSPNSNRAQD